MAEDCESARSERDARQSAYSHRKEVAASLIDERGRVRDEHSTWSGRERERQSKFGAAEHRATNARNEAAHRARRAESAQDAWQSAIRRGAPQDEIDRLYRIHVDAYKDSEAAAKDADAAARDLGQAESSLRERGLDLPLLIGGARRAPT